MVGAMEWTVQDDKHVFGDAFRLDFERGRVKLQLRARSIERLDTTHEQKKYMATCPLNVCSNQTRSFALRLLTPSNRPLRATADLFARRSSSLPVMQRVLLSHNNLLHDRCAMPLDRLQSVRRIDRALLGHRVRQRQQLEASASGLFIASSLPPSYAQRPSLPLTAIRR
jgi:hypothetical protein